MITLTNLHTSSDADLIAAAHLIAATRKENRAENPELAGKPDAKEKRFRKEPTRFNAIALCFDTLKALVYLKKPAKLPLQ